MREGGRRKPQARQGRKDPLPGLAHGRLGQAHQRETGQALTHQVHFHIHREGIHPFQTGAVQSYDHTPPRAAVASLRKGHPRTG